MKAHRTRFWLEAGAAATTAFLAVLTLITREWIEAVFGVDPDRHSGSLEWTMVAAFFLLTLLFGALARAEARRPLLAGSG